MEFIKVGDVIINIAAISTVSKRSVKGNSQIRVTMINPEEGNHSDGSTIEVMKIQKRVDPMERFVTVDFVDAANGKLICSKSVPVKKLKKEVSTADVEGKESFEVGGVEFLLGYNWAWLVSTPIVYCEPHPKGHWRVALWKHEEAASWARK